MTAPLGRRPRTTRLAVAVLLPLVAGAARLGLGSQTAEASAEGTDLLLPRRKAKVDRPEGAAVVPSAGSTTTPLGPRPPASHVPWNYKSAGTVFYTRDADGAVSHVLLGVRVRDVKLNALGQDKNEVVRLPLLQIPFGERYPKKIEGWNGTVVGRNFYDTAQKWWIVQTADAAGFSKFLEVGATGQKDSGASCGGLDGAKGSPPAMYHKQSRMALVFCQIGEAGQAPPTRGKKPQRMDLALGPWKWSEAVLGRERGMSPFDPPKSWSALTKARRSPSAGQSRPDELRLTWVPAQELLRTFHEGLEGAKLATSQGRHPLHPFTRWLLTRSSVRRWLGVDEDAPASSASSSSRKAQRKRKPATKAPASASA